MINGVFFALNPHVDPLFPPTLVNGYDIWPGTTRADDQSIYPFLDSIIRSIFEQEVGPSSAA